VFGHVRSHKPDMIAMLGDFHYSGHVGLDEKQFRFAMHEAFKSNPIRDLYESAPLVLLLDDHDIG
jgi:hypothetical protein